MRQLDAATLVAGQIRGDDIPLLKQQGVTMIVNNRPDDEEAGQPLAAEIEQAAAAAGLGYRFIPIARGIGPAEVEAMREALDEAPGKVLAFCRTGTRSALVWALAQSAAGKAAEEIEERLAEAGYSPAPIAHLL